MILAVLVALAFVSQAVGQLELKVETRLRVEAPAGYDAYTWQVPAPLQFEQRGSLILVDGPAGTYRINVSALRIDWDERKFEQQTGLVEITIGKPAPPEPEPNPNPTPPDVPEDEFDNIGQRSAAWAKELQLANTSQVAKHYEEAGLRLAGEKEPIIATIDLAEEWIAEQNDGLTNSAAWRTWGNRVNESYQDAQSDRLEVSRFYRAVAAGLEVVE